MDLPVIAIPSYQRASMLVSHTLGFLMRENYPADKIYIFVANQEEWEEYDRVLPRGSYSQLVVGVRGLLNQRRFINEFFPEGQILVQMDDDVRGVKSLRSDQNFLNLVNFGVSLIATKSKKGRLFGVLPNDDGRKMREQVTRHLTHIIGSFFICINDKDCVPTVQEGEDYERSILYFRKYGEVYRWQGAGVATAYMKNAGGLQQPGRLDQREEDIGYLLETYPTYCSGRVKSGGADLLLNWRASSQS